MQFVPHAFLLGFEVALVVLIGLYFDGHIFNNFREGRRLQGPTRLMGLLVSKRILLTPGWRRICAPTP